MVLLLELGVLKVQLTANFKFPEGIALDKSGKVFVADVINHRVQVFNNGGTFIRTWGSAGSANGLFNTPFGVAIDSSGNVYVADSGNNRIQKFKNDGTFIRKWGTEGSAERPIQISNSCGDWFFRQCVCS